jgi:hypothetical protein
MNVLTANDPGAAEFLALARPQAGDGQGRHAMRLAGTGQVTASRAVMIAAAPGRARQQLTPALTGAG